MAKFGKGESGNPGGRPKGTSITSILRKKLDEKVDPFISAHPLHKDKTYKEALCNVLIENALMGQDWAFKMLYERAEGKVTDKLEHSGDLPQAVVILPSNGRGSKE